MVAAHADEISMTVNYINDQGFIYVRKVGGVDPAITKAQRVIIHSADGPVKGVVGNVAPHLAKMEGERKVPKMEDLFIDIGAKNRKEAQKLVRVGDPITLNFADFENDVSPGGLKFIVPNLQIVGLLTVCIKLLPGEDEASSW